MNVAIFLAILHVALAALLAYVLIGGMPFAPWVPTMSTDFVRVHKIANLQTGQTFYDVGCGDGRVCIAIARMNTHALIVGIERSLLMYLIARFRVYFSGLTNVKIHYANALTFDFSKADVIYLFGMADTVNSKIEKALTQYIKQDLKIISYVFPFSSWKKFETKHKTKISKSIYIYQF